MMSAASCLLNHVSVYLSFLVGLALCSCTIFHVITNLNSAHLSLTPARPICTCTIYLAVHRVWTKTGAKVCAQKKVSQITTNSI